MIQIWNTCNVVKKDLNRHVGVPIIILNTDLLENCGGIHARHG